jgi:arabinosyltransferase
MAQVCQSCRMVVAQAWGDDIEFSPAKILQNTKAAANMHIITVDVGQEISAGYTNGGQFLQIKVGDSKPAFLAIANAPAASKDGTMEFLIKFLPDSTAGHITGLSAGDNVRALGWRFPSQPAIARP